ncbi:MAG: DUF3352 domain-containing protein, partial [Chloroflexia bacterium]|nr:DUF3352 domain-containing protein [Chloroflexia bacterium]
AGLPSLRAGIIVEATDKAKAQQAMDKIEGLLAEQGDLSFAPREIAGVEARVVPMLALFGYMPGYAFVDDFMIIAIDEASFEAAFQAHQSKGERMAAASEFEKVSQRLPEQRTGLFYLDFQQLSSFLDSALQEPEKSTFREETKPFLDILGGMGMSGASSEADQDYMSATMYLRVIP